MVITDTQGNIEYVNPKFTQVTGHPLKEIIGTNAGDLEGLSSDGERQMWDILNSGKESAEAWRRQFSGKSITAAYLALGEIENAQIL